MKYDSTNYIDTLGLKQAVFFGDGGYSIDLHSYANSKEATGNEYKFDTHINGQKATSPKIERQTTQFGGRLYKTPKAFVHHFGFHLQIKAPPALLRQQHSTHKVRMPIKCMMGIQIPSLLEMRKSDTWDKFIAGRGTGSIDKDINNLSVSEQIKIISKEPNLIFKIKNPKDGVIIAAMKKNPSMEYQLINLAPNSFN
jgi:hypothetical protein